MTIVLDQSCSFLADQLREHDVFVRRGDFMTVPDVAVRELRETMHAESILGPYLLVGASFAGLTALLYAYRFPQEVAGLLLLDSTHPRESEVALSALSDDLPDDPEITAFREFVKGFGPSWDYSRQLFDGLGSIGDIPLVALAAELPPMPRSLPEPIRRRLTEGWHALQRDHARRSSCGEMRIVSGSGHEIARHAPDVVVATVKDMIRRQKAAQPGATDNLDGA